MTKPFSVSELLARVEALCRRVGRSAGNDVFGFHAAVVAAGKLPLENVRLLLPDRV